jgi:hypothetical protein
MMKRERRVRVTSRLERVAPKLREDYERNRDAYDWEDREYEWFVLKLAFGLGDNRIAQTGDSHWDFELRCAAYRLARYRQIVVTEDGDFIRVRKPKPGERKSSDNFGIALAKLVMQAL